MSIPLINDTEVLVKVVARPINPSDHMFIEGNYRIKPNFPQIAGLEGSGIITHLGKQVKGFNTGDHVAFRSTGTWAEFAVVNEGDLVRIDADIPFEMSSQLSLNPLTAYGLLEVAQCVPGSFLLLSAGASAVSKIVIQIARERNIKAICLVRDKNHSPQLINLGAFAVLQDEDEKLAEKIMSLTEQKGVRAFLDAVGGDLLDKLISTLSPFGHIVLYGRYSPGFAKLYNGDIIYKNLTIYGFGIGQWLSAKSYDEKEFIFKGFINSISKGNLKLEAAATYPLEAFMEAINADSGKKIGKIILK